MLKSKPHQTTLAEILFPEQNYPENSWKTIVLQELGKTRDTKGLRAVLYPSALGGSTCGRLTSQESKGHCIQAIQIPYFRTCTCHQGEKLKVPSPDPCGSLGWVSSSKRKASSSIPTRGICLGFRFSPTLGLPRLMFLSLSFFVPSPLSKNKEF